jgi:signal transduction histidine kinase
MGSKPPGSTADSEAGATAVATASLIEIDVVPVPLTSPSGPREGRTQETTGEGGWTSTGGNGAAVQEYWCVAIQDNGPGVPEEHLPLLFEPFFTTKDVGDGTGLGLSIVHGIVQEHGGRIEVSNRESGGACFKVFIPKGSE